MLGDNSYNTKSKINLKIILIGFILSTTIIIASTPIHEGAHWVMSEIDPYVDPVEIHVFDESSYNSKEHVLPSALGSVVIEEKYPGAFNDRPFYSDIIQEIICISIQVFLAVIITLQIIKRYMKNKQKTTHY